MTEPQMHGAPHVAHERGATTASDAGAARPWLISAHITRFCGCKVTGMDAELELTQLGFSTVQRDATAILAVPPAGWTKTEDGNRTEFRDRRGVLRLAEMRNPMEGTSALHVLEPCDLPSH